MKTLPIDDHNQGVFFHKLGHFFPIFQKGQRRPQSIDKMLLSQNESSLTYLLLYGDPSPMLMHPFSTQHSNSYYFQEDSMDRYLTELNFFFSLIHFSYGFLFVFCLFIWLSFISTYTPTVCYFLHLVLLAVSFAVINFLFS